MDRLEHMFNEQAELQLHMKPEGRDLRLVEGTERIDVFKDMKLALEMELAEALEEMGWKPWATSKHWNEEAVQAELVDAWHFFVNLCLLARLTPEMMYTKYMEKRERNLKRQLEGYDGVTGKCPKCKRALDDLATFCDGVTYCVKEGYYGG